MGLVFETDRDTLEGAFTEAAEAFGKAIAREHFGEEHMDWTVSGGAMWGGEFAFTFDFNLENGDTATFHMRLGGIRNMEPEEIDGNGCAECARSYGPNFTDPCTEH